MGYAIPVLGWFLGAFFSMSIAVPFCLIWNALAPTYFYFAPEVYQHIPFWHCVGLFMLSPMIKILLVPKFSNITQTTKSK